MLLLWIADANPQELDAETVGSSDLRRELHIADSLHANTGCGEK
jgi:hypothetical protein